MRNERNLIQKSLLIIGAGGHGQVVAEVAEDCGYTDIAFLDDNNENAIGKINEMGKYLNEYQEAFVGIGNNKIRYEFIQRLINAGYKIPTLIHPTSYVSKSACIGIGTVVEPKSIINAYSNIGVGAIISIGAIVDHDVQVGKACHINSGAIVKAGAKVGDFEKLEAGEVLLGY